MGNKKKRNPVTKIIGIPNTEADQPWKAYIALKSAMIQLHEPL